LIISSPAKNERFAAQGLAQCVEREKKIIKTKSSERGEKNPFRHTTESRSSSQTLLITILSPYAVASPSLHLAQILKFQTGRSLLLIKWRRGEHTIFFIFHDLRISFKCPSINISIFLSQVPEETFFSYSQFVTHKTC
jgi:hypothetical protein